MSHLKRKTILRQFLVAIKVRYRQSQLEVISNFVADVTASRFILKTTESSSLVGIHVNVQVYL